MKAILAALALVAALALAGCQYCVDGPSPHAVVDQPLGARCSGGSVGFGSSGECVGGLACLGSTCTISCATAPTVCPEASICVAEVRDQNGNLLQVCLPACTGDADCLLGATAGTCLSGFCKPRSCVADDDCRGTGRCVGYSEARGITWNDYCSRGWCQL